MKMTKILYAGLIVSNLIAITACGNDNVSLTPSLNQPSTL